MLNSASSDNLAEDIATVRNRLYNAQDLNAHLRHAYTILEDECRHATVQIAELQAQVALYHNSDDFTNTRVQELMNQVASLEDRQSDLHGPPRHGRSSHSR